MYNRPFVRTNFGATRFKVQMYKFVHLYSVVYKFVHLYFCTFVRWCNTKFVHLYVQIQICTFVLLYICTLVQSPPGGDCTKVQMYKYKGTNVQISNSTARTIFIKGVRFSFNMDDRSSIQSLKSSIPNSPKNFLIKILGFRFVHLYLCICTFVRWCNPPLLIILQERFPGCLENTQLHAIARNCTQLHATVRNSHYNRENLTSYVCF